MRTVNRNFLSVCTDEEAFAGGKSLMNMVFLAFVNISHTKILNQRSAKINIEKLASSANAEDGFSILIKSFASAAQGKRDGTVNAERILATAIFSSPKSEPKFRKQAYLTFLQIPHL